MFFWNQYILAMMLYVLLFMNSASVVAAGTVRFEIAAGTTGFEEARNVSGMRLGQQLTATLEIGEA